MIKKGMIIGFILAAFSFNIFADNIGYIDMEVVFKRSTMIKKFEEKMNKERKEYQEIFLKKQEKLEKARKKGKSDADIEKMISDMEKELKPKQELLAAQEGAFQADFITQITKASKDVSKEIGIDVVMDKRVVFYGGLDMTTLVLEKLND